MPSVNFWWKPGCSTNTRQISLLRAAGCVVDVRDLLTEAWTAEWLASFFSGQPVAQWFNPAAPAVKSGAVDPAAMTPASALGRLIAEPLLIRRPLVEINGQRCCGFDTGWLAVQGVALDTGEVPEACSHHGSGAQVSCPPPVARTGKPQEPTPYSNPAAYVARPSGSSLP